MSDKTLDDDWIPVALSEGLDQGDVMRVVHGDQDLVVWRGHDKQVRCFDNRCPHRGMRLSHGFVRGNRLSCLYHGWQYDGDGACRYIPAHPDLEPPKTLTAGTCQACEFDGLVWISTGAEAFPHDRAYDGESVRSLVVDRSQDRVRQMLRSANIAAMGDKKPSKRMDVSDEDAHRVVLRAADVIALVVALRPLNGGRTMLHVQTKKGADAASKITVSRWLERFRWIAENSSVETGKSSNEPEALSA